MTAGTSEGKCRSCHAAVVWARRADGKSIPLDAMAPGEGNIRIDENGFAVVGKKGTGHYQPHFVTCRDAAQWRRKKTPAGG